MPAKTLAKREKEEKYLEEEIKKIGFGFGFFFWGVLLQHLQLICIGLEQLHRLQPRHAHLEKEGLRYTSLTRVALLLLAIAALSLLDTQPRQIY